MVFWNICACQPSMLNVEAIWYSGTFVHVHQATWRNIQQASSVLSAVGTSNLTASLGGF